MTDSQFKLGNKYLENAEEDFLYHFGFGVKTFDIPALFGDTKVGFLIAFEEMNYSLFAVEAVLIGLLLTLKDLPRKRASPTVETSLGVIATFYIKRVPSFGSMYVSTST